MPQQQLYSTRSQPTLRTQAASSNRLPERYAATHDRPRNPSLRPHADPVNDRPVRSGPRNDTRRPRYPEEPTSSRSLRSVASSSQLARRHVSRDDMPPPPHPPFPRPRPQPTVTIPYERAATSRHQLYDERPAPAPSDARALSSRARGPSPASFPKYGRSYSDGPLQQPGGGDHRAILDRMRENGWSGVGGGGTASDDGLSHRSVSSTSSAALDERLGSDACRSASLSKVDSGYSDGESEKTAGERVLDGWSALKKAVVGLASDGSSEGGQGAQIWNKLTTTLAASVETAWAGEDDGSVGPDGETKLGRAIKAYHLSRIERAEDVPEWLLSDAERARYRQRPLLHARSTGHLDRSLPPERPLPRQHRSEDYLDQGRSRLQGATTKAMIPPGGASRGSAADRLQRMRDERRMRGAVGPGAPA